MSFKFTVHCATLHVDTPCNILFLPRPLVHWRFASDATITRCIQDSETSIDFVQGPPGSRRERVNIKK